jgi:hypothetical protein
LSGQVGDLEPELLVDSCLHGGVSGADDSTQVAEAGDEGPDVVFGELAAGLAANLADVAGECCGAFGLDLAGPLGDGLWVGSGVEGSLVPGEAGVAVAEGGAGVLAGLGRLGSTGWVLGCC